MEKIQVAPLPGFRKNATNIATWQYVLNKASEHEKAAIKFLKYAASREGNIAYAECMKRLPARLDVIREEKLDIPGFQVFQDYVNHVELKERPFSSNPMKDISKTGILFQQYVMDQISQDEFCEKMEEMQKKSEIVKETEQIEKNDLLCFFCLYGSATRHILVIKVYCTNRLRCVYRVPILY